MDKEGNVMKKLIIILFILFSIISCRRVKLPGIIELYEDPNVIIITIEKKNDNTIR